jgi:hypothetical protein
VQHDTLFLIYISTLDGNNGFGSKHFFNDE